MRKRQNFQNHKLDQEVDDEQRNDTKAEVLFCWLTALCANNGYKE